jgi:uncharacterized protein YbgA (DUF1722 family)/uncharacterized protein YbbK (DUF523 family)
LGNRVRHNGEHKKNDWILAQLGPFVSWIPICPEVEMGLGVPRETMRLIGAALDPKLVTVKTKVDQSENARQAVDRILRRDLGLDAYILKKDSPTCGLERVKVYGKSGIPVKNGIGIFAKSIREKYPRIPMIEEGRLSDPEQREAFLIHLFMFTEFNRISKTTHSLQSFHQTHKLHLMAYDPGGYHLLGRVAANPEKLKPTEIFLKYEYLLSDLLQKPLTPKKYVNVFQHMLGYFKKDIDSKEKTHLLKLIEDYKKAKIPFISVTTLFDYLVKKHSVQYLESQSILRPYPEEIRVLT